MDIHQLLQRSGMTPEEISRIKKAYEQALHALGVKDRDDPLTQMVAKTIIRIAQTGIHDPAKIADRAIKELGVDCP
jgi:hypothetical protein